MSINIDEGYQTVIVLMAINITSTFVWWSRIRGDRPVILASTRYNTSKKVISCVDNSIVDGNQNTT